MFRARTVFLAGVLLAAPVSAWGQDRASDDAKALEGVWKVVRMAGMDARALEVNVGHPTVVIKDGRITLFVSSLATGGELVKYLEYRYVVDTTQSPTAIDLKLDFAGPLTIEGKQGLQGRVLPSIFELTRRSLRIQSGGLNEPRPQAFSRLGDGLFLERMK